MSDTAVAPAASNTGDAPIAEIKPGAAIETKENIPIKEDPYEFELDVKGQKIKHTFKTKDELRALLQKATYADSVIKEASQKVKGTQALMEKLKTPAGIREVLNDPAIGVDVKEFALGIVRDMMNDEKLTPEQRKARDNESELEKYRREETDRKHREEQAIRDAKSKALAQQTRNEIIGAMKKYPDVPQTQATMDACILNMRAAFVKFGKHLTADQAMTVYSQHYWKSLETVIDKMTDEQISSRFGKKILDKIQKLKLNELKKKTDPGTKAPVSDGKVNKKKHLTEKEFDKHFKELAGL